MTSIPTVAIAGRPNVGKSTLFNRLTNSRNALEVDLPGTTRDRIYGPGKIGDFPYIVVDTGGIGEDSSELDNLMSVQSWLAIEHADCVLFMVDAGIGVTQADLIVAKKIRKINKPIILVVNKIDGLDPNVVVADFHVLGFTNISVISAVRDRGLHKLVDLIKRLLPENLISSELTPHDLDKNKKIKVTFVGRPNAGKSTLVNRILGENRVVMSDVPGTTRDSVDIDFIKDDQEFTLIDTAGMRKKSKINEVVEKFSVIKALQAISNSHVAVLVMDATREIADQDLQVIKFIIESGKSLVIAVNKWDGLDQDQKDKIKYELNYKLDFIKFVKIEFISALHGTGVGNLFVDIINAYKSATDTYSTNNLTTLLNEIVTSHPPPSVLGRRIKLRYAHMGGINPPHIIIHGNQTQSITGNYTKYLINIFIKKLKLEGTPVKLSFKSSDNPYKEKKNTLTLSQMKKRKRLINHVKNKKR